MTLPKISLPLLASLLACFSLTAHATPGQTTSLVQYVNNTSITIQVKHALLREPSIKSNLITVSTNKDTVTLGGYVSSAKEADRVLEVASNVKGVETVIDNMEIKRG